MNGDWVALTANLPGSSVWPDGGRQSWINGFSITFGDNLRDFAWDRSIAGRVETMYSIGPKDFCLADCCVESEYQATFDADSKMLGITQTGTGMGFGGYVRSLVLETHLDSVAPDGRALFKGGSLSYDAECYDSAPPRIVSGTINYLTVSSMWSEASTWTESPQYVHLSGRWDPIIVPSPWPGGFAVCGWDGFAHLNMLLRGNSWPWISQFDWTSDLVFSGCGDQGTLRAWAQPCPATLCNYPFGDMDLDCDVDLLDYAATARCLSGTASLEELIRGLRVLDVDGDLDMDLVDFAAWQMSGPQEAPQSCCGPGPS